nr:uncharacterized protein LOC103307131 [Chrysemys picta bellii]
MMDQFFCEMPELLKLSCSDMYLGGRNGQGDGGGLCRGFLPHFLSPSLPGGLPLCTNLCVSIAAPLSAPTLSLHPPHPEFFEGERLTLRCSAPRAAEPTGYRFFDQSGERLFKTPPDLYREGQLHLTAQLATTGAYSCAYWRGASGQETPSEKSQPVSVQVKDAPAAPSLSLNPRRRVYRAGDSVGLVCSAPPSVDRVKGFQYFGDRIAVLALASSKKNYTYNLNITGPTVFGSYSCSYWVRLSGRNVPARRSEPVVISMRGSWSRELAVGGSFFTLNCLIFLVTYFLMKCEGS